MDISYIQGKLSDKAVSYLKSHYDFVIIRLGIRLKPNWINTIDDVYEYNYKKLNGKLPIGTYFYSRAINKKEAKAEAQFCIKHLSGKSFQLPIYLDVEDKLRQQGLSKSSLTTVIKTWCSEMEKAGCKYGLYASMSWLQNEIDVESLPDNCSIWVAQYWIDKSKEPSAYKGVHDIWQYSSSGKVSYLSGSIDMDYLYKEFNDTWSI